MQPVFLGAAASFGEADAGAAAAGLAAWVVAGERLSGWDMSAVPAEQRTSRALLECGTASLWDTNPLLALHRHLASHSPLSSKCSVATIEQRFDWRTCICSYFAWAVPNDAALQALLALGPLVELGAGTGYWAWLLSCMGADIVAYDVADSHEGQGYRFRHQLVRDGGIEVLKRSGKRALLLCWPDIVGDDADGDSDRGNFASIFAPCHAHPHPRASSPLVPLQSRSHSPSQANRSLLSQATLLPILASSAPMSSKQSVVSRTRSLPAAAARPPRFRPPSPSISRAFKLFCSQIGPRTSHATIFTGPNWVVYKIGDFWHQLLVFCASGSQNDKQLKPKVTCIAHACVAGTIRISACGGGGDLRRVQAAFRVSPRPKGSGMRARDALFKADVQRVKTLKAAALMRPYRF
jgi:hypothetical protein